MALTTHLDTYLSLERQMMALDRSGDPLADLIRDAMDRVWYGLSDEEHHVLDSRMIMDLESLYAVHLKPGRHLFVNPPELPPPSRTANKDVGKTYENWKVAA